LATITIENCKVEKIITGYGFRGSELKVIKGEEKKSWYTIWTKEAVTEGDVVTVEGELTVKLEDFTGRDNEPRKVAAVHVNNALVMSEAPF